MARGHPEKIPGFLIICSHLECKTDTSACAEICGHQGTSGINPRVSHYLIFILMVKRIQLLALISSRTAVLFRFFGAIRWAHRKGARRGCGSVCRSFSDRSIARSGSQAVGLSPWTEGQFFWGLNSPALGVHLTSWDRKPDGPNESADFAWALVCWHSRILEYRSTAFGLRSCGRYRGYLYLRASCYIFGCIFYLRFRF